MNGHMKSVIGIMACMAIMLSFSTISQAESDFSATTNALQQQGFIREDQGGAIGNNEMALNPFRNADQLNYGGIFGPLGGPEGSLFGPPPGFGTPPPNTRNMGFEVDSDHYTPINRVEHSS